MRTIEQIKDEVAQNKGLWNGWNDSDVTDDMRVKWIDEVAEKYAQQFKTSVNITDEEIKTEAEKRYGEITGGQYHAARPLDIARFIKGATWLRDKLQQNAIDPVAFAEWLQMQSWSWSHSKKEWKPWVDGHVFHNDTGKSTAQLLQAFKEELNKK